MDVSSSSLPPKFPKRALPSSVCRTAKYFLEKRVTALALALITVLPLAYALVKRVNRIIAQKNLRKKEEEEASVVGYSKNFSDLSERDQSKLLNTLSFLVQDTPEGAKKFLTEEQAIGSFKKDLEKFIAFIKNKLNQFNFSILKGFFNNYITLVEKRRLEVTFYSFFQAVEFDINRTYKNNKQLQSELRPFALCFPIWMYEAKARS